MRRLHSLSQFILGAAFLIVPGPAWALTQPKLDFNRDVRPILSNKCFNCHGPDDKQRKAELRLDVRDNALKPAKSGAVAIVPGKPEKSELIARITTQEADDVMPPPKIHKKVSDHEAEVLRRWIAEGAEYRGHWAFQPVRRPAVPALAGGITNPIDAFILDRLSREGLQPSPEADKATLIRRVTLDLTGLPPTPANVDAFLFDHSPGAYERAVDRLLASAHYGEQMAQSWLDSARYADSHGFQTDSSRTMWPWRDWVIKAFNDNVPFDRFTIEQIAGDLLPNATRDQVVATGFNRNHRINGEGGIITEEWRIENIIDRVETTSFTWLGLTLNCCRCHDHKYDPFTQRDFYSFFAFFNNIAEAGTIMGASNRSGGNPDPYLTVPTPEQGKELARREGELNTAEKEAAEASKELPKLLAAWEPTALSSLQSKTEVWNLLEPGIVVSKLADKGAKLTRQGDGSWLASGPNPPNDTYIFNAPMPKGGVTGFLLECLPDPSLPNQSLGRYSNGNFVLSAFDVFVQTPGGKAEPVKLAKAVADYSQGGYGIENLAAPSRKRRGKGWAIDGPTKKEPRKALFVLNAPIPYSDKAQVLLRLRHEAIGGHNIGRFRISATAVPAALLNLEGGDGGAASVRAILKKPAAQRTPAETAELRKFYIATVDSPAKRAEDAVAVKKQALESFREGLPTTMVMKELDKSRDAFILKRGEYDKPGDPVHMATPAILPPMPVNAPLNRLGLAEWLVDRSNPLTARVWVNRVWERLYGVGICKTTENLGSQAEYPVHPELLDWLASEFMRTGWDMKAMQKLMVMSATYRQSSRITRELLERDPENRLLARGPRFRLCGEAVRDQALAIAGLMAPLIGGPSVRPYMPEGVWDETSKYGDLRGYKADAGTGLYRRSLYTIWKRTAAPPTMLLFDAPTREICTVKRSRTNTPLQALALLNEVTFVEAARGLAQRMMKEGGATSEKRITFGYKCATAREPETPALQTLLRGFNSRLSHYQAHADEADELLSQGAFKADPGLPVAELAAYTTTASVLLNLDRVITRD